MILLKPKFSDGFQAGNHFWGLISKTLGAFLVSKTSALRGTLCEWQHASHLSQASKQKHSNDPTTHPQVTFGSKAPTMKDALFLHLNLPTVCQSESRRRRKSQRKSPDHCSASSRLAFPISASPTYRPKRVMTTSFHTQSSMISRDRSLQPLQRALPL